MRLEQEMALSFQDVLLVPQHFTGISRTHVNTSTVLCGLIFDTPVISANMRAITEFNMVLAMSKLGGLPILHRMCADDEQISLARSIQVHALHNDEGVVFGGSFGVKSGWKQLCKSLINYTSILCLDVAHADQVQVINTVVEFRKEFGDFPLIVGNFATPDAINRFVDKEDIYTHLDKTAFKVGVGGGCFVAGTRVLMANGTYCNIEDIQIGDKVINKNGKSVTVRNAWCTGKKQVLAYKTNIWYEDTFCTPDHLHWCGDLNTLSKKSLQSGGYKKWLSKPTKKDTTKLGWKSIGDFKQDVLFMPNQIDFELENDFQIALYKRSGGNGHTNIQNEIDIVLKPSYELGYIFGTYLGDGNCAVSEYKRSKRGSVWWTLGAGELDIVDKLNRCLYSCFNKQGVIDTRKENVIKVALYYKPLADFFKKGFGKRQNKQLPSEFLVNNKDYLRGILDGLYDTDGNFEPKRNTFTNTSSKLIELFNVVFYLLEGYFPNNQKGEATTGGLKNCNIDNCHTPYLARSLSKPNYRILDKEDLQIVKLTTFPSLVEKEVLVYDIEVDCPTHSFIANNAIVHNSSCSTRVRTGCGIPTLQSLFDCEGLIKAGVQIIADGGIQNAGDLTKSLAAGSSAVMLGSLLAATEETPGSVLIVDGRKYKPYFGNASFAAKRDDKHVEGEETLVPYKGPVAKVVQSLEDGLRSGMSYCGAKTLNELHSKAVFRKITQAGWRESMPHALMRG